MTCNDARFGAGREFRSSALVLWVEDRKNHFSPIVRVLVECVPVQEDFATGNLVLVGRIEPALISFHRGMKRDVGDAGVVLIAAALTLRHQLSTHCRSEYFTLRDWGHVFSGNIFLGLSLMLLHRVTQGFRFRKQCELPRPPRS